MRWPPLLTLLAASLAIAQAPPQLQAVFPAGGRAGSSVEIVLRGGIGGASQLMLFGGGLSGSINAQATTADAEGKKLFEATCASCHALRSPDNRQMSPPQWEQTVDRMIHANGADIPAEKRATIVEYLRTAAAAGLVTGRIDIAPDAEPGRREVRVVTPDGVSTAFPFLVSTMNEVLEAEPNDDFAAARPVDLPAVINAACEKAGDVDTFQFTARAGQRLLCRVAAYRLNPASQNYFDACLFLYDSNQKLLAKSLGFEDLDPLLDFTAPADGTYYLQCRDLLYRGGAADVYRLEVGELGYHQSIYPLGGQRGERLESVILSENQPARNWTAKLARALALGLGEIETPFGAFPFHFGDWPEHLESGDGTLVKLTPPCVINGWVGQPGEKDRYLLEIGEGEVRTLAPWAIVGPFAGENIGGLERVFPPERDTLAGQLELTRNYPTTGASKTWEIKEPNAAGQYAFGNGQNEVWYAARVFEMQADSAGMLSLGTDDGCKVWVNGELVHVYRGTRPSLPANDLVPIRLRRGSNTILLKIINVSGPGGFTASAGAWRFELFAKRLGSPLTPSLKVGFGPRWIYQSNRNPSAPDRPGGDVRWETSFAQGGEYGLLIEDTDGQGGERYAYRVAVTPALPSVELRAYPSNPSVPRGGRIPLTVDRVSLGGYSGDIRLEVEGLPPGLTASPAVIPYDQPSAVVLLTAARNATPAAQSIRLFGEVDSLDGPQRHLARGQDHFRIQNNAIPVERRSMVASLVAQDAPYTLEVAPRRVAVAPGEQRDLKVTLRRRPDFDRDVVVTVRGLPPGVGANTTVFRGKRAEATLQLTFNGNLAAGGFGGSLTPDAYQCVVAGASGGNGITEGMLYCSEPVVLQPYDPTRAPARAPDTPAAMSATAAQGRRLLEQKCATCHALIDPEQTRQSLADWTQTVDRMIGKGAAVNPAERGAILAYLKAVTDQQT